ncbi:hypothetical protein Nazgul57 [Burkholderia phage BcepNazgul]|uniref:DUF7443 domain-containing protein n=1 Tax=Burkholderia phage BcepNazgul TaxID=242861 RepID=Q6UYI4_9CAUD|nr:hypothetical protein Nazgul57 [Burkholderia phage BcepNazgul]AAQ63357.1 hypothetical protein Nazgul57 [Burkholderia phage BcepNazgul]
MPKRVPKHTVITTRDGKIVHAAPGKPFDFTDDEIEHLHERHGKEFLQRHVVEVEDAPAGDEGEDGDKAGASKPAKPRAKASASGL